LKIISLNTQVEELREKITRIGRYNENKRQEILKELDDTTKKLLEFDNKLKKHEILMNKM
jgi:hypothetical protein